MRLVGSVVIHCPTHIQNFASIQNYFKLQIALLFPFHATSFATIWHQFCLPYVTTIISTSNYFYLQYVTTITYGIFKLEPKISHLISR